MPLTVLPRLTNKNEQISFRSVHLNDLPSTAVLVEALKPLELTLVARGLAGSSTLPAHPLWFLAETERNVFLWRHGLSLGDQEQFEFWVDIPALIERRKKQVDTAIREPGFGNPFVGDGERTPAGLGAEIGYLDGLASKLQRIYLQAFELSLIARTLQKELISGERPIVLLPYLRAAKS
jgi:hypothetical protein